jgi:hypothetical protein
MRPAMGLSSCPEGKENTASHNLSHSDHNHLLGTLSSRWSREFHLRVEPMDTEAD